MNGELVMRWINDGAGNVSVVSRFKPAAGGEHYIANVLQVARMQPGDLLGELVVHLEIYARDVVAAGKVAA